MAQPSATRKSSRSRELPTPKSCSSTSRKKIKPRILTDHPDKSKREILKDLFVKIRVIRGRFLQLHPEPNRNHWIELERRHVFVDLRLLGLNVALNRGSRSDRTAVRPARVARAPGEVERHVRRASINRADFNRNGEPVPPRHKVAESHAQHRPRLLERNLPRAAHRIARIAHISNAVQRKRLPARHRSRGRDLISVVEQRAGTQMKASMKREPVEMRLARAEVQPPVVADAVFVKCPVVTEGIEAATQVEAMRQGRGKFATQPKQRCLHADPYGRKRRGLLPYRNSAAHRRNETCDHDPLRQLAYNVRLHALIVMASRSAIPINTH